MTDHDIVLIWDPNLEEDFNKYLIYRSIDNITFSIIGTSKQPHFTDRDMPESLFLAIYEATAGGENTGKLTLVGDYTSVFTANSYFIVRRSSANDGTYKVKSSSFGGGVTSIYPYSGVSDGTDNGTIFWPYYYRIAAIDKLDNESGQTASIIKTSPMDVIAPATPTGLTARRLEDYSGVQLFWEENNEVDLKGYIIYRTYDGVTYHIAAMVSANNYKDDDVPRSVDPYFDATYVAYAVAAYDKSGNVGVSTSVVGFFTIPTIRSFRASLDYLSLNISWKTPLPEDNITGVAVWYKRKVDTNWTHIDTMDWPTSRVYLEGPLLKDTEYDVAIGTYISTSYGITDASPGSKFFKIAGDHVSEFPAGAVLEVTGSTGNDGQYTITQTAYVPASNKTRIIVAETVPSGIPNGTLFCFTLQVPIIRAIIPDYEEDTTPPTNPWGLAGRADPRNDRVYLSWNRVTVDDDFLRYEILTKEAGDVFILHGTSRDSNYILNDASYHTRPDGLVYVMVRAVDRSGNVSSTSSLQIVYYSYDLATGVEFLPQWVTYTEDYYTSFQHTSMRKYVLTVNDAAEKALFFRRHILFSTIGALVAPYDERFGTGLDGAEVLAIITSNQFTYNTFQDEDKTIVAYGPALDPDMFAVSGDFTGLYIPGRKIVVSGSGSGTLDGVWTIHSVTYTLGIDQTYIYVVEDIPTATGALGQVDAYAIFIWPGVEDWFGAIYIGPSAGILAIVST